MILLGSPRMTIAIDLLVPAEKRSQWLDLMRGLGFRLLHGTEAFAQFEANPGPDGRKMAPVEDLEKHFSRPLIRRALTH